VAQVLVAVAVVAPSWWTTVGHTRGADRRRRAIAMLLTPASWAS
jgi:hypothetical protein